MYLWVLWLSFFFFFFIKLWPWYSAHKGCYIITEIYKEWKTARQRQRDGNLSNKHVSNFPFFPQVFHWIIWIYVLLPHTGGARDHGLPSGNNIQSIMRKEGKVWAASKVEDCILNIFILSTILCIQIIVVLWLYEPCILNICQRNYCIYNILKKSQKFPFMFSVIQTISVPVWIEKRHYRTTYKLRF